MDVDQLLATIGYNFRQQGAGVAETFLGSPAAQGVEKLVPNFVWGLAGLAGNEHAAELFQGGVNQANEMTGVEDPKNFAENANRIALSALLPGPKVVPATSRLGRAGQIAGEIALPLNQMRSVPGAAVSVGLPVAVSEGAHAYQEANFGDDGYHSIVEAVQGKPQELSLEDEFSQLQQQAMQVYERTLTSAPQVDPLEDEFTQLAQQVQIEMEAEKDETRWGSAAAAGLFTAALLGGAAAYRSANKAKLGQTTALHGVKPVDSNFDAATMLKADVVDQNAPIYKAAEESLQPFGATNMKDIVDDLHNDIITTVSPHATAAKTEHAMATGFMPGSTVRAPKLAVILESLASLPDDMAKLYDEALTARDKAQQMLRENSFSWGSGSNTKSINDLAAIDQAAQAVPEVNKLLQDTHTFYRSMREYLADSGMISNDKFREWNVSHNNYVPSSVNFEKDPTLGLIREFDPEVVSSFENMVKRQELEHGIQPGEGIRPSHLHALYLNHVIRAAENNRIRREFFDLIGSNPNQKFATRVYQTGDDTVTIMRNGGKEHWKVDPILGEALKFKPILAKRLWNTSRRIMQEFTTGRARPDYIPTAVALELGTSVVSRNSDMGMGLISEGLNRANAPRSIVDAFNKYVPIDPTAMLAPITGTARGIWSDVLRAASINAEVSLNTNGRLAKMLGPQATKQLADTIGDMYARTTKAQLEGFGGGNAPLIEHQTKYQNVVDVTNVAPTFAQAVQTGLTSQVKATALARYYTMLVDNMHNSVRLQHAASNMRKGLNTDELTRIAGRTRELTGDVSQHGGQYGVVGKGVPAWITKNGVEKVPYFNIAIQSFRAVGRGLKEHPIRNAAALSGLGWVGLETMTTQSENPIIHEKYWDEWTPEQRANAIPFFADDGSIISELPIPHELRGFWSALVESYGTVSGLKAGAMLPEEDRMRVFKALGNLFDAEWTDEDRQDLRSGIGSAAGSMVPRPVPPLMGAVAAAGGVNPNQLMPWEGRFGSGFGRIREEKITAEEGGRIPDRIINNNWETAINELIGASAAPLINAADTAARLSKDGYDLNSVFEGSLKQFQEGPKDRLTIAGGEQMWDWEKKVLTQDSVGKIVTAKMQKLDDLEKYIQQERRDGSGSTTPRPGVPDVGYYVPETIAGTELGRVASAVKPLHDWVNSKYKPQVQALFKQLQSMPANSAFAADPTARRAQANEIVKQIRAKNAELLELITDQEDEIGAALQRPHFRLEDLDPGELKKQPTQ